MATLADLKASISEDMERYDIAAGGESEDVLLRHINKAIRRYRGENWWFLTRTTTVTTTISQNYVTRPTTIEKIRRLSIPALGMDLQREDIATLEMYDEPTVQTGQPLSYAEGEAGTQLRLWPTPNAAYSLKIVGTRLYAALAVDADESPWTNEGFDLIAARTRMTLCRDVFRDTEGAQAALADVQECLATINGTNIDRIDAPMQAAW